MIASSVGRQQRTKKSMGPQSETSVAEERWKSEHAQLLSHRCERRAINLIVRARLRPWTVRPPMAKGLLKQKREAGSIATLWRLIGPSSLPNSLHHDGKDFPVNDDHQAFGDHVRRSQSAATRPAR